MYPKFRVFLCGQLFCTSLQKLWQWCVLMSVTRWSSRWRRWWLWVLTRPQLVVSEESTQLFASPALFLWCAWGETSMHTEIKVPECWIGGENPSGKWRGWWSCYRSGEVGFSPLFLLYFQDSINVPSPWGREEAWTIKLLSMNVIHTWTLSVKNCIFLPINQLLSITFEVKKNPEGVCVLG